MRVGMGGGGGGDGGAPAEGFKGLVLGLRISDY